MKRFPPKAERQFICEVKIKCEGNLIPERGSSNSLLGTSVVLPFCTFAACLSCSRMQFLAYIPLLYHSLLLSLAVSHVARSMISFLLPIHSGNTYWATNVLSLTAKMPLKLVLKWENSTGNKGSTPCFNKICILFPTGVINWVYYYQTGENHWGVSAGRVVIETVYCYGNESRTHDLWTKYVHVFSKSGGKNSKNVCVSCLEFL